MEMKIISDSTVKITITLEDLEERDMELSDFLVPQEKTEEFFYTILDEIELPESFKNSGMLSFRVTPKPKHIDVFVTKSEFNKEMNFEDLSDLAGVEDVADLSPEDLLKTLEKAMKDSSDPEAQARLEAAEKEDAKNEKAASDEAEPVFDGSYAYVLAFSDLKALITFAKRFKGIAELSEVYKDTEGYYLALLLSFEEDQKEEVDWVRARLLESAKASKKTRAYLAEHAYPLLLDDALEQLRAVPYQVVG